MFSSEGPWGGCFSCFGSWPAAGENEVLKCVSTFQLILVLFFLIDASRDMRVIEISTILSKFRGPPRHFLSRASFSILHLIMIFLWSSWPHSLFVPCRLFMSSFTPELSAWCVCVCFCKGFLCALKCLPLPTHPACCVPSGFLAVDIPCSPPALATRDLSLCAESHTETLWLPGHFSIVHSLELPFTDALFRPVLCFPPRHGFPGHLLPDTISSWLSPCWFPATLPAGMQ